ncbi:MAG: acetyl-CoA acetyltransferase [Acidimicrobiales bacterium]
MKGSTAVVGIGESQYYKGGRSPHSALQLAVTAIRAAVDDAGLSLRDVDGFVSFHEERRFAYLASLLGCANLRFSAQVSSGGGNISAAALLLADAAVHSGQADVVVAYRSLCQSGATRYGRPVLAAAAAGEDAFLTPFGSAAPVVKNALLTKKFMHDHGVSNDAVCEVAMASYAHAQHNPRAVMHGRPLSRDDYYASRLIADPFRLFDCCQESDGAAAVVVTRADRARDLRRVPVYLRAGAVGMQQYGGLWAFNDASFPAGRYRDVGRLLWEGAGVRPDDVPVAQFYENFTGTTLMAISDMGLCEPEELNDYVAEGNLRWPDGRIPMNTSGGNLAEAYIQGFQLLNEGVRQIRGDATCQVPGAELSLVVAGPGTPPGSAVLFSAHGDQRVARSAGV